MISTISLNVESSVRENSKTNPIPFLKYKLLIAKYCSVPLVFKISNSTLIRKIYMNIDSKFESGFNNWILPVVHQYQSFSCSSLLSLDHIF
jgi:hypothetical protein